MALPTGSGTETLHSHLFNDVDATQTLIFGVQHHVYTVLSIVVCCTVLNATTDVCYINIEGHDAHAGTSAAVMRIQKVNLQAGETFVWNDKFSFNGVEPTGTAVLSASEQVAIAAQSGSAVQELQFTMTHATDSYMIVCTYLDQDWT
jgi:hypothetical protein